MNVLSRYAYLKLVKYLYLLLFMQHYLRIVLNEETVSKMRIALKFHFSLELPQHCQLSGEEFVFLAVKGDAMRPFAHMRLGARAIRFERNLGGISAYSEFLCMHYHQATNAKSKRLHASLKRGNVSKWIVHYPNCRAPNVLRSFCCWIEYHINF